MDRDVAHMKAMVAQSSKMSTGAPPRGERDGWYRGVKLQAPSTPPKTSLARLQEALKHAIAKNAHALSGRQ